VARNVGENESRDSEGTSEIIRRSKTELAETLAAYLTTRHAPHYRATHPTVVRARADRFVDAFCAALANRNAGPLDLYLQEVTPDRIEDGYHIEELHFAFRVLEETAWEIVRDSAPKEALFDCLREIRAIVRAAGEHLAHIYLRHEQTRKRNRVGGEARARVPPGGE
jgi:hypothetical protein